VLQFLLSFEHLGISLALLFSVPLLHAYRSVHPSSLSQTSASRDYKGWFLTVYFRQVADLSALISKDPPLAHSTSTPSTSSRHTASFGGSDSGGGHAGSGLLLSWLYVTAGHFEDLPRGNASITSFFRAPERGASRNAALSHSRQIFDAGQGGIEAPPLGKSRQPLQLEFCDGEGQQISRCGSGAGFDSAPDSSVLDDWQRSGLGISPEGYYSDSCKHRVGEEDDESCDDATYCPTGVFQAQSYSEDCVAGRKVQEKCADSMLSGGAVYNSPQSW
jgi:hypothetical protein